MKNTITHLKTKVWYRFLKVVYIVAFTFLMLIVNLVWLAEGFDESFFYFLLGDISIILVFYLIKGAFYYIAIGEFIPKK
jgi:hypothetical protein